MLTSEEDPLNYLRVINILEGHCPVDFQRITQFYLYENSNMNIYFSAPIERNSQIPNFNYLYSFLNNEHKEKVNYITENSSSLSLLSGTAGTGKSFVIKCLSSFFKSKLLVSATTGIAASLLGFKATTVHSL